MAVTKYSYVKDAAVDRLTQEIQTSAIVTALDHIDLLGTALDVYFKDALSAGDVTVLDGLVTAHVNTPLPENSIVPVSIDSLPPAQPFADPLYRTKHNATTTVTTIANNSSQTIDYVLSETLFASGGTIVIKNAKFGDWVSAEIHDPLAVIPVELRPTMAEAWPTVATYIIRQYLELYDSNSIWYKQGVDTRPLVAEVSAGLSLRVTYNAVNDPSGDSREAYVNYFLNKKL